MENNQIFFPTNELELSALMLSESTVSISGFFVKQKCESIDIWVLDNYRFLVNSGILVGNRFLANLGKFGSIEKAIHLDSIEEILDILDNTSESDQHISRLVFSFSKRFLPNDWNWSISYLEMRHHLVTRENILVLLKDFHPSTIEYLEK